MNLTWCVLNKVMLLKGFTRLDLRHVLREAMTPSLCTLTYYFTLPQSKLLASTANKMKKPVCCQHRRSYKVN
jgi:hypothetical protein